MEQLTLTNKEVFIIIGAAICTLIFSGIGALCRKIDIFAKLSHPIVKKYPNISKSFGTIVIYFSLIWLSSVILIILSNRA